MVSRAGSGVSYVYFQNLEYAREWMARPDTRQRRYVFEYGEPAWNATFGSEFAMMESVKNLFDPNRILNPGRLYGRL